MGGAGLPFRVSPVGRKKAGGRFEIEFVQFPANIFTEIVFSRLFSLLGKIIRKID
jgi:hypothetical protein